MRPVPAVFGALCGLIVGALVSGVVAYVVVRQTEKRTRAGWNLVPVTVLVKDQPSGHVLTRGDVASRQVPEQFVTASVVKPDSWSYVVGQPLVMPWRAGEPFIWAAMPGFAGDCGHRLGVAANELGAGATDATWELVGAMKQRHPVTSHPKEEGF